MAFFGNRTHPRLSWGLDIVDKMRLHAHHAHRRPGRVANARLLPCLGCPRLELSRLALNPGHLGAELVARRLEETPDLRTQRLVRTGLRRNRPTKPAHLGGRSTTTVPRTLSANLRHFLRCCRASAPRHLVAQACFALAGESTSRSIVRAPAGGAGRAHPDIALLNRAYRLYEHELGKPDGSPRRRVSSERDCCTNGNARRCHDLLFMEASRGPAR
jgi:hypothetical protein